MNITKIENFIEKSVEWLIENQQGCCIYKLDDRLGIAVGWSQGFGQAKRDDVIQAENNKDYGIVTGIKVWTSDDLGTDYDWYNYPYYSNGDVVDYDWTIQRKDIPNANAIAEYLVQLYGGMESLDIDKNGLILNEED